MGSYTITKQLEQKTVEIRNLKYWLEIIHMDELKDIPLLQTQNDDNVAGSSNRNSGND